MITDSEFIIMDGWARTNQQYLNDVNFLSSEIYRLVEIINKDRKRIKALQDEVKNLKSVVQERTDALIIEADAKNKEAQKSIYLQTYIKVYNNIILDMLNQHQIDFKPNQLNDILLETESRTKTQTIAFLQMYSSELFTTIPTNELTEMTK